MTKNTPLSRPATSAIAAFLVLSVPNAFAQETPVAQPAPPTVMVPPVAPTTAPAPITNTPVAAPAPAPVLRVPVDIAPEPAAPKPAAETPARVATKTSSRPAAKPVVRPGTPERIAPVAAAPAATAALPDAASAATLTETAIAPIPPVDPAPTSPPAERAVSDNGFPWEIVGGAAALLLVGGAGLAFARRRGVLRDADNWEFDEATGNTEWVPAAPAARTANPTMNPEPIPAPTPREEPMVTTEPVRRTTPAFAAAPSGSMGRHEAMALVGPTADNPFETLAKRLKRARFLDRKERFAYDEALATQEQVSRQPASAWDIAQRPALAPAEQLVRRPEPVTRGLSHRFRHPGLARD